MVYKITGWTLECSSNNNLQIAGYVFGHPSCYDGQEVTTSGLIEIRDCGDRFIARTINSEYELMKSECLNISDAEKFIHFTENKEELMLALAEKLLKEGDALFCMYSVILQTEGGPVFLSLCKANKEIRYKSTKHEFYLKLKNGNFLAVPDKKHKDSCLYVLRAANMCIEKYDYKSIRSVGLEAYLNGQSCI